MRSGYGFIKRSRYFITNHQNQPLELHLATGVIALGARDEVTEKQAMRQMLPDIQQAGESVASYSSDWEYLADELRRLDLLIRLLLSQEQHEKPVDVLDQFRGLVVSDEEIARLLADPKRPGSDDRPLRHELQEQKELAEVISQLESCIQQRLAISAKDGVCLSLPLLARLFYLTRFEEQCLIICLAPELDRKYEKLYAYLQDDVTRKKPSADLALNLLCRTMPEKLAARYVFDPRAPLLGYRLLQMTDNSPDAPTPLLQRFLKLDDRIVSFLLGFRQMDARLEQSASLITPGTEAHPAPAVEELRARMGDFLKAHFSESQSSPNNMLFYLRGPYGSGKRMLAETVSHDLGLPLIVGDVEQMLGGPSGFEQAVLLLSREAVLQPAALCLENMDGLLAEPDKHRAQLKLLVDAVRTFSRLTFLLGAQAWQPQGWLDNEAFIALEMPRTDVVTRKQHWESYLNSHYRFADDVDWGVLAGKFRLQPGQMRGALAAAENLARWRASAGAQITMADLHQACRAQSTPKLEALAHKIEPKRQWHEIVLPDDQLAQIREICEQVNHRQKVYDEWGFARKLSRGRGLNALFSGPPGTGKTMAAEILALKLQLDLYQPAKAGTANYYLRRNLMPTGTRVDPYRGFNFLIEIDGITQAGFQEVGGLDSSTDAVDYREGPDPNHVRKLTGLNKFTPITLKRGITDSDELWKWRDSAVNGKPDRKNGSIVLLDETGAEKLRWNFFKAWPSKWTGPAFNSTSSAVAIETLEITHEELKRP